MQNDACESFDGRIRDELLNEGLFLRLDRARTKIAEMDQRECGAIAPRPPMRSTFPQPAPTKVKAAEASNRHSVKRQRQLTPLADRCLYKD